MEEKRSSRGAALRLFVGFTGDAESALTYFEGLARAARRVHFDADEQAAALPCLSVHCQVLALCATSLTAR